MKVSSKILGYFGNNRGDVTVFVMSVLLASCIWLIRNLSMNYTDQVRFQVIAECNIDGHDAVSSNSESLLARCRATGFDLMRLGRSSGRNAQKVVFSRQDLHQMDKETFFITAADLNKYAQSILGDDAKLETFLVDTLYFRFPLANSRKVPVNPVYTVSFEPQYCATGSISMKPDSVTVYGEPSIIDQISEVSTVPFRMEFLSEIVHGNVSLETIEGVRMSAKSVEYTLGVSRFVEVRTAMPVYSKNVPSGKEMVAYPSNVEVVLRCRFPLIGDPLSGLRIFADYQDFSESVSGRCVLHHDALPQSVIECRTYPEVVDCIERQR